MAEPIKWRTKILLAKEEATYGVDPVPATANGILGIDVEIKPMEGQDQPAQRASGCTIPTYHLPQP